MTAITTKNILEEMPLFKGFGSEIMNLEFEAMKLCLEMGLVPGEAKEKIAKDQTLKTKPTA